MSEQNTVDEGLTLLKEALPAAVEILVETMSSRQTRASSRVTAARTLVELNLSLLRAQKTK